MKVPIKLRRGEPGIAVLGIVLILVIVGGALLPVLLYFMNTASQAGQIVERKTKEYYSANSGIEAAQWRIKTNGKLPAWLDAASWDESVYGKTYENYTLSSADPINDNSVYYLIGAKWVLENLEAPNLTQKRDPASNILVAGSYQGSGSTSGRGKYEIIIMYDGTAGSLGIKRIGCWLPAGFEYVPGSSSLEKVQYPVKPYYCVPQVTPFRGGHTITWDYATPVSYDLFDPPGSQRKITFEYTPNQITQGEFNWVKTSNTTGLNYLAWNTDLKVFEVKSTATSPTGQTTNVTAYTTKKEFQKFGASMEGDYFASGNTLMRNSNPYQDNSRDRLYEETWATVSGIPTNANVEKILLYWSGWKCKPWDVRGYSQAQLDALPESKNVHKVKLTIEASGAPTFSAVVTASQKQGASDPEDAGGAAHGWSYSCIADVTDLVMNHFEGTSFMGNGKYTVGHWDTGSRSSSRRYELYEWNDSHSHESISTYTRYPLGSPMDGRQRSSGNEDDGNEDEWAYSAWSVVIIYTSPTTKGHQIYIFDDFHYVTRNVTVPITISGFLTPELAAGEEAARYTHFVGEGDEYDYWSHSYTDSVSVNGYALSDADNPANDVCNSQSRIPPVSGTLVDGIDIDTFSIANGIVQPNDTEAQVNFRTGTEVLNIVYVILSFRSNISTGGILIYDLK
ncbi:MAG: hypothetical protein WC566_09915 [Dehalococcoidia bacterium]